MENPDKMSIENCESFAQANFQYMQLVYRFLETHKNSITYVLPKPELGHRDTCIKGLWSRIYFWLHSLNRLNEIKDFQAYGSANRALLEFTVDLALLHKDKTNSTGWKMWWWNLSEKLKGAEQIVRFFTENKLPIPDTYSEQQKFIENKRGHILEMRDLLWGGKHPRRWSGNGNLFDDLVIADEFLGNKVIEILDKSLTEYYRTQYKKMNWHVHSGVSSFWNLPKESFPLFSGFFLKGCADLAMLSTQIVLKDFGLNEHLPNYEKELENLNLDRMDSFVQNLNISIPEFDKN